MKQVKMQKLYCLECEALTCPLYHLVHAWEATSLKLCHLLAVRLERRTSPHSTAVLPQLKGAC